MRLRVRYRDAIIINSNNNLTVFGNITAVLIFLSVMTQLPAIIELGYSSLIAKLMWGGMFIIVIIKSKGRLHYRDLGLPLVLGAILFVYANIAEVFTGNMYTDMDIFACLYLSIFVLFISYNIGFIINQNDIKVIAQMYVVAVLIICLSLYFSTFMHASINTFGYLYSSKNSISVIIMTALIVLFFEFVAKTKNKIEYWIGIAALFAFAIMILFLKCRAIIISIPLVLTCALFKKLRNKRLKVLVGVIVIGGMSVLLKDEYYDLIINQYLLNGFANNLDAASSGRIASYSVWWDIFKESFLVGDGESFFESMPLAVLAQFGIVAGIPIILYAFSPLLFSIRKFRTSKSDDIYILLILSIVYIVDSVFEMLAPFGPGMRSLMLWFWFGILLADNQRTILR